MLNSQQLTKQYQLERSFPHKSDILPAFMPVAKEITMQVLQVILMFFVHDFKTTDAICHMGCEKVRGKNTHNGFNHRALVGHSFKNFTVNKPFDFLMKCSHELVVTLI